MRKSRYTGVGRLIVVLAALLALAPLSALADRPGADPGINEVIGIGTCHFEISAQSRMKTMALQNSCVTTESIVVPHGTMLDGNGYIITATDPEDGYFSGAVITNEPVSQQQPRVTINVTNMQINAGNLKNKCDTGDARLRGIRLNGASGSVTNVTILALNQGASGCQEGNGIEVTNSGEQQTRVTIANNTVLDWQKTGILVAYNVRFQMVNNFIGESATEENLAPNSVQIYDTQGGTVVNNNVHGSQWLHDWNPGDTNWVSTGFLLYFADDLLFDGNTLNYNPYEGNAEIGLYLYDSNNGRYSRNRIFDNGADRSVENGGYWDIGIYADCTSTGNIFGANQVRGFNIATDICYTGPGRGTGATSMTTLSRGVSADDVEGPPPAPQPFI